VRRAVVVALLAMLVAPASAQAAFPGHNGKIAFSSNVDGDYEIYTINPDGTGLTQLTHNTETDWKPNWSADGSKILFDRDPSSIWVMNADGSAQAFVTSDPRTPTRDPGWSPDATHIAYSQIGTDCDTVGTGIVVADADGSNEQFLTCQGGEDDGRPRWSPDGQKIAFYATTFADFQRIYTINPDGTGVTQLTTDTVLAVYPDWSPDGSKILFTDHGADGLATVPRNGGSSTPLTTETGDSWASWSPDGSKIVVSRRGGLHILNSDGTNPTFLTQGIVPDWQPIPFTGYPRPQAASPIRVSLALAYDPCTKSNRTHGPPLESPSCNPPQRLSQLTVGTFDSNGQAAKAAGSVRLKAVGEFPIDPNNGDQSDVEIQVKITDVRNRSDLSDYAGEVGVSAGRRITDRDNMPAPGAATVQDDLFSFAVPCSPTPDTTVGSTCALATTADTLVPGSVKERQRAVWQLGRIAVHDSGPQAGPGTSPVNRVFMTQGIFVP
jgi:Tol biopolymer transport system component